VEGDYLKEVVWRRRGECFLGGGEMVSAERRREEMLACSVWGGVSCSWKSGHGGQRGHPLGLGLVPDLAGRIRLS